LLIGLILASILESNLLNRRNINTATPPIKRKKIRIMVKRIFIKY